MSVEALDWAFSQDVRPAARKLVLITAANYLTFSDDSVSQIPSSERLAAITGLSVQAVQRHLRAMLKAGIISESREGEAG
jgi:DNA-binding transcriptional ArsR family regulator